jgi:uncharacterized protein (TIGR03083 family)
MLGASDPLEGVMEKEAYLATFRQDAAKLADAARMGMEPPVSGCPGWTVADLVMHIGEVHRSWTYILQTGAQEPPKELPDSLFDYVPGVLEFMRKHEKGEADPKNAPAGLIGWYEDGAAELERIFRALPMDEEVAWHWSGDKRGSVHLRNQAIEVAVHRWDAQHAHNIEEPIDAALACDAIDQHFEVQLPARRKWTEPIAGNGESYHFHATDGEGEWYVRFDGDQVEWSREHRKGDVAMRGTASDLLLWLFGRIPADRLEVVGNRPLLDRYVQLVPGG